MDQSTILQDELTEQAELAMLVGEIKDFKADLQSYIGTSQKAVKALNGPIISVSMSQEQKSALKASEHTLNGILGEIEDRFGRYL